MDIIILTC